MNTISRCGLTWLKLSVVYLIAGIALGIYMGATENFELKAVHAHINLVGWAIAAIAGITYCLAPAAGTSKLGRVHFWLHQIGAPLMLVMLAMLLTGNKAVIPGLVIGEFMTAGGVVVYLLNLFFNVKATD